MVVVVTVVAVVKVYCVISSDIASAALFIALTRTLSALLGGGAGISADVRENSDMIDMNRMRQKM